MNVTHMIVVTKRALLAGAVGFVLAACGGSEMGGSTRPVGTVHGRISAGPTCPVERVGQPCPPRPVLAAIQATEGSRVVASTRSATDGSYRLELPIGSYTISAATSTTFPRCIPRQVNVTGATDTEIDLMCDTGIR
jgi:hypothetical protein